MPGPMSDAGSSVSSARLTGWSTTSASPLTNGTSSLTRGSDQETPDSAQMCTGEFFNPPAAVVSEPYEQQGPDFSRRTSFLESFYAGGARISATLPRGFRRSEGCSRLSTGITPRLFGAKPSKVSSLPKVYSVSGHSQPCMLLNRSCVLYSQKKVRSECQVLIIVLDSQGGGC